ncbi:MAG: OmpA family protein [Candidatus Saccharibacteria bacterium]|nr:OmpA family protein [Pseudorhodobacter sp.]
MAVSAFVIAAALALLLSWSLARLVETRSAAAVTTRLLAEGYTWAIVKADGLTVTLSGTAPNEAMRFSAMNLAGSVIESGRMRDEFQVEPAQVIAPPRFSLEILRNDDDVQLIGLLPSGDAKDRLAAAAAALARDNTQMDMLQTAAYPSPAGFDAALDLGLVALNLLPQSKISVSETGVVITAIAKSEAEKRSFEADIARATPKEVMVQTTISAPRPVLTPFTLRFVIDEQGPRFDACSADSDKARDRIMTAARAAGVTAAPRCVVGLGVPSPSWAQATSSAMATLAKLGAGTVTFSDADITLLAGPDVTQASFDREIGELRATLPDVFSLDAKMPEKAQTTTTAAGPVEFTATLAAETHSLDLRGRLTDNRVQAAVASFARARFGADKVRVATVLDPAAPDGWPQRVLAGLQSLAQLDHGTLLVRPDTVEVAGVSGSLQASAKISQTLSERLGQGKTFKVNVSYDKALDPLAALPTPQECVDHIHEALGNRKIAFDPGSAEIDSASASLMDAIAKGLKNCNAVKIEIAGHTDAQGSAGGNLALSQARAEAVMVALQGRQVDVSAMRAVGYGEGVPVADNGDESGREANRRIDFTLIDAPTVAAAIMDADGILPGAPSAGDMTSGAAQDPSLAPTTKTERPKTRPKG